MRKLFLFMLVFGLMFSTQHPSSANSCSLIKSKIKKIEKSVKAELKYFEFTAVVGVDEYDNYFMRIDNYLRLKSFTRKTWLNDIWKLGMNNPQCFTTSQKIKLRDPSFKSYKTYLQWKVAPIEFEDDDQIIYVEFPEPYHSIYEF